MFRNRVSMHLLIFIILSINVVQSQEKYTLLQAIADAKNEAPLSLLYEIAKNENELKLKNLNTKYLPQLSVNGQATYQSETTGLDIQFPGVEISRLSKDQYKVQLDANQMIFDGGITNVQKNIQSLSHDIDINQIDLDIEQVREQIINVYFSILEAQIRNEVLSLKKLDMLAAIKKMEVSVNNGVVLSAELKNIKAAYLGLEQTEFEINTILTSQINILNLLTNRSCNSFTIFEFPEKRVADETDYYSRPMFKQLALRSQLLEQNKKLEFAVARPRILLFGQLGYGKPGLNFLKNEFAAYYVGGLKFQWNLGNLYTRSRDIKINHVQSEKLNVTKKAYTQQLEIKLATLRNDIQRYALQMVKDDEIISLREDIKNVAALQMEKGTRTSADYLSVSNDANEAILNKKIHLVQWLRTNYLFNHHAGKF